MNKYLKNNSGFTLIELIIVVAIIGILATAVISGTDFLEQRNQSVDTGNYNIARNLQSSFEQYVIINGKDDLTYAADTSSETAAIATDDDNLKKLAKAGVTKTGYSIPLKTFWLIKNPAGYPEVKFKLVSKRFGDLGVIKGTFAVPSDGALR